MTAPSMTGVKSSSVGRLDPSDSSAEVPSRRTHENVIMIGHQTVGVHAKTTLRHRFGERLQKSFPIPIISKDLPLFVAARHHMIHCTWKFHTNWSSHDS